MLETTKFDSDLKALKIKANQSLSEQSKEALDAAITYIEEHKDELQGKKNASANSWGIYTYFYNDKTCDYQTAQTLEEG
jgi:hypothetical protein